MSLPEDTLVKPALDAHTGTPWQSLPREALKLRHEILTLKTQVVELRKAVAVKPRLSAEFFQYLKNIWSKKTTKFGLLALIFLYKRKQLGGNVFVAFLLGQIFHGKAMQQ